VFISAIITPTERQKLISNVGAVLAARRIRLSAQIQNVLIEELVHAVGRSKPGVDLTSATDLHRRDQSWLHDKLNKPRSRRKEVPAPDINSRPKNPFRIAPPGPGRPANTAHILLMHDVRQALKRAGVRSYFKTGFPTLLTDVVQVCGAVAGLRLPQDLKKVWDAAKTIE
jgi:hypothetical protein